MAHESEGERRASRGSLGDDWSGAGDAHSQILAELRRTVESLADESMPAGPGWMARSHSLPDVFSLNCLHVTRPAAVAEILRSVDEAGAGLSYRHIVAEDLQVARELEASLRPGGWKVEREVLMALAGPPGREVDTRAVTELGAEEMLELMRRWWAEVGVTASASETAQLAECTRREGALWNEVVFGARDESGAAVAVTKLRSKGATGWVEDVYTVPEARERGLARMLVTHATRLARAAGNDLTFIIADDDDWPKHLYEEIGFRATGRRWAFHRGLTG